MVRKGILVDDAGRGVDQPLGYPYFRRMGWQTKNKAVVLAAGRIVVPLYSDGFSFSLMALPDDGGRTWTFSEPLVGGGNIQPSIATQPDGTLVAYMRDNGPRRPACMSAARPMRERRGAPSATASCPILVRAPMSSLWPTDTGFWPTTTPRTAGTASPSRCRATRAGPGPTSASGAGPGGRPRPEATTRRSSRGEAGPFTWSTATIATTDNRTLPKPSNMPDSTKTGSGKRMTGHNTHEEPNTFSIKVLR
jgi:hypothetical protein